MVASGAPDAIAAVITEDGSWAGAAGIAGANGRKATPKDEFAIASITKTFTAALVMRLVEQGKMDLDEPLASYMGDLKVDTNGATVRQALETRAGLADYPQPAAADHIRKDAAHVWTAEEMAAEMAPPVAAAGETYLYSSAAWNSWAAPSNT
jgi:D-alanyl-D-alanine carboxypeptidase